MSKAKTRGRGGEERIVVGIANVVNAAVIGTPLESMRSPYPGHVISKIVNWNVSLGGSGFGGEIVHATEVDEVLALLADVVKTLAYIAVVKVVDQVLAKDGSVTHDQSLAVVVVR